MTTDQAPAAFLAHIDQTLETSNKWTREAGAWTFKDPEGRAWNGTATVEPL